MAGALASIPVSGGGPRPATARRARKEFWLQCLGMIASLTRLRVTMAYLRGREPSLGSGVAPSAFQAVPRRSISSAARASLSQTSTESSATVGGKRSSSSSPKCP